LRNGPRLKRITAPSVDTNPKSGSVFH